MTGVTESLRREARGGVLIIGGGFGGAEVARKLGKRGSTIVSPENSMLFAPMLPEAASGMIELRHVVVPLAMMCPHAEVIVGRVVGLDAERREARVETDLGLRIVVSYEHVVVAVGAVPRTLAIPGLVEHAVGCATVVDGLYLRNQILRLIASAAVEVDPQRRSRQLTFVFVGGGYAGVETLAELEDLARDALRHYPTLRDVPQRWVLVDAAPKILAEIPSRLGQYAAQQLVKRGVDVKVNTRVERVQDGRVTLSDGTQLDTALLVWSAGVKANPIVGELGLPLDERGKVRTGPTLQVEGYKTVWSTGDCASVPNAATPDRGDPPTSQHALRQARQLAANLKAVADDKQPQAYKFRALGQVATLGRNKGIADLMGIRVSGFLGWIIARTVHLMLMPGASRRLRVVIDWVTGFILRRDIVAFGSVLQAPPLVSSSAPPQVIAAQTPAADGATSSGESVVAGAAKDG